MPPITLDGSLGITTPTYGGADTSEYLVPVTQFKNRIINGAMVIDQRNAGASVTQNTIGIYAVDRFISYGSITSKFTVQRNAGSVTPPAGFTNYLGITSSSSYSVPSNELYVFQQSIEGLNCSDLDWGTANAKTVTLSFWVRSSLTGTFGGSLRNADANRSYPFSYTISSANTWEQKSITIAGDTTGTWLTTNGSGISLIFSMGSGSSFSGTAGAWAAGNFLSATGATSVVGTNGATFYITGVQLEVGSTATSFDYRPYGTELQLCQRYYQQLGNIAYVAVGVGMLSSGRNQTRSYTAFPSTMRTSPTATASNLITTDRLSYDADVTLTGVTSGTTSAYIIYDHTASGTAYQTTFIAVKNATTGYLALSAEL